jgi:hypothetical protein
MTENPEIVEGEVKETAMQVIESSAAALMPAMSVQDALKRRNEMNEVVKSIMVEDKDYGTIPGTKKPTLYKPGAEKLTTFFGLTVTFINEGKEEQWDSGEPFFYYLEKCQLHKGDMLIAEASASANSREDRYRWRWTTDKSLVNDDGKLVTRVSSIGHFRWQIEKAETTGKYGKPQEYWDKFAEAEIAGTLRVSDKEQPWNGEVAEFNEIETIEYRIPNPDIFSLVNTILKMAQKRALVAATLIACDASEFFTQDLEDGIADTESSKTANKTEGQKRQPSKPIMKLTIDEQIEHAKTLIDDPSATNSALTTAFWSLGRSMGLDDDYLTSVIADFTADEDTSWTDAIGQIMEHQSEK